MQRAAAPTPDGDSVGYSDGGTDGATDGATVTPSVTPAVAPAVAPSNPRAAMPSCTQTDARRPARLHRQSESLASPHQQAPGRT